MNELIWGLIGLIVGILIGITWREAIEILRGKQDPMVQLKKLGENQKTLFSVALILAFAFNGLVGVGLLYNSSQDSAADKCQARYQELSDSARDERLMVQAPATLAEKIDAETRSRPDATEAEKRATAKAYSDELDRLINARILNPYPPSDYCSSKE